MADEHFFPGPGDFSPGLGGAAPFFGSSYAPPPPPGLDAAAMMQGFGLAWAATDLQLPDSSAAATAHFDSALSSLVSSPAHNDCGYGAGGDDVAIGDLIGRLGSICSAAAAAASASNSCYSTPLSSPPRGAPSAALAFRGGCYPGGAAAFETAGTGARRLSRVASSKSLGAGAGATSPALLTEMGGVAEMRDDPAPPPAKGGAAARKRKASGKAKATSAATTAAANASPKRSKLVAGGGGGAEAKEDDDPETAAAAPPEPEPEPAKDYIHVRARRGQATDSHSLAERVRRERISERMKMLQSLVPGCNKITGKALMLDEIINYVQSLQRQVEFLSMKLATMNPELDADARYHTATAMLASSHPPAAAFSSSYAAADLMPFIAAHGHPAQLDSCPGWEAQQDDLHSVVVRHNHNAAAAVRGHDLYPPPSPSPPGSGFHGK